jgi:hypothetical protein
MNNEKERERKRSDITHLDEMDAILKSPRTLQIQSARVDGQAG